MAVDFFGNEISVGDKCVFIEPNYSELNSGVVVKITPFKTVSRTSNQIICKR